MKWKHWLKTDEALFYGLILAVFLAERVWGLSWTELFQLLVLIGLWEIYRSARQIKGKLDKIEDLAKAGK